jgi:hypothetical protein
MIKTLAAAVLAVTIAATAANAQAPTVPLAAPPTAPPAPGAVPTPALVPTPAQGAIPTPPPTPPPAPTPTPANAQAPATAPAAGAVPTPAAAPTPTPNLLSFTGQLLDVRGNFVYFTTGDAFPAIDTLRVIDYFTSQPTTVAPKAKMFARATFDPATKKIIELAITTKRLPTSQGLGAVSAFVVVGSTPAPAPEIVGQNLTGRQVAVVFEVTVPPTTSFTDAIYISTDVSQWNPTAIKLDRIDGYRYRAQRFFASGTKFAYRVTRGSWNSVERGEDNLDSPPHQFFVREVDALAARVTVYHWSDERGPTQGAAPDALPTPYNPSPFGSGPFRGIPGQRNNATSKPGTGP